MSDERDWLPAPIVTAEDGSSLDADEVRGKVSVTVPAYEGMAADDFVEIFWCYHNIETASPIKTIVLTEEQVGKDVVYVVPSHKKHSVMDAIWYRVRPENIADARESRDFQINWNDAANTRA